MNNDSKSTAPPHPPRLSHMVRTPDFNGYGFNLHTIKNKAGQFIGQVDQGSPAETALLKEGDKIIEVNGVNIASENHKQVVSRIKLVANQTILLVIDAEGDAWYKEHNIVITSDLPEVIKGTSAVRRPSTSSSEDRHEDRRSLASASSAATSEASNRQDSNQATADAAPVRKESSAEDSSEGESDHKNTAVTSTTEKEEVTHDDKGDTKSNASSDNDDKLIAKELIANGEYDEAHKEEMVEKVEESTVAKTRESSDSEFDDETAVKENLKNVETMTLKQMVQDNVATKREADEDSNSSKSRSNGSRRSIASVSSASSRGSGGHSQGTDRVADKSPMSTSPSPPSSVGAPSPTPTPVTAPPTYNKNIDGLNMNMSVAEMRAHLASKKKKDIRQNTDINLRQKYEIIQKL